MNAIDYLLQEHDSHRNLLNHIESNRPLYLQLREELIHHVNMEEAILYPNLLKLPELEAIVREAWEEHSLCMQLVQEMDDKSLSEEAWLAKFRTLKKLLIAHLEDEELKLFPKIKAMASEDFLFDVGEQMLVQKIHTSTKDIIYPDEPGSHKL